MSRKTSCTDLPELVEDVLEGGLLRIPEVAQLLGIHETSAHRLCARGDLAYTRVFSERRVPRSELRRYIAERMVRKS